MVSKEAVVQRKKVPLKQAQSGDSSKKYFSPMNFPIAEAGNGAANSAHEAGNGAANVTLYVPAGNGSANSAANSVDEACVSDEQVCLVEGLGLGFEEQLKSREKEIRTLHLQQVQKDNIPLVRPSLSPVSVDYQDATPSMLLQPSRSYASSQCTSDGEGGSKKSKRRASFMHRTREEHNIPRLVHRNLAFDQSKQTIAIENKTNYKALKLQRILFQDWYHVFLKYNTVHSVFCLLLIWTTVIIIFALIYMKIDARLEENNTHCGLGTEGATITFGPAFAFSLETCTTVGYGLPNGTNAFFEPQCGSLQTAIYFQMVFSMLFNAFLFAFFFNRLARCDTRGSQVIFSQKAIIEKVNGKWLMHVRIYDYSSSQPIVEAHVRMYCVSWQNYAKQTRDLVQPHLLHEMRVLQPDDDQGATVFPSIPLIVTHQIDTFSPLRPEKHRMHPARTDSGGLQLREIDQDLTGSGIICPVCGESYGSHEQLSKHIKYTAMVEKMQEGFPVEGSHGDQDIVEPYLREPRELKEEELDEFLKDKEIMVVLEGIEPMVSGTFQALQSYKHEDIHFNGRFAPCMKYEKGTNGKITVDVDEFHKISKATSDDSIRKEFKIEEP